MTVSGFFDRTVATRRNPGNAGIDVDTGEFEEFAPTLSTINIHVTRPKQDEVLPGGAHLQAGDVIVFANAALNLEPTEILEFWDAEWRIVAELRRYDVLDAATNYKRRSYVCRRANPTQA